MKKNMFIVALSTCGILSAMEEQSITLPDAKIIKERLSAQKMSDRAIEVTRFDTHFANRTIHPSEIPTEIKTIRKEILQTTPDAQKKFLNNHMKAYTPSVVAALLSEHPEALQQLKDKGLLQ